MSPNPGSGIFTSRSDPGAVVGGVVVADDDVVDGEVVDGEVVDVVVCRGLWILVVAEAAAPPPAARMTTSSGTTTAIHVRVCWRALPPRPIGPPVCSGHSHPRPQQRPTLLREANSGRIRPLTRRGSRDAGLTVLR